MIEVQFILKAGGLHLQARFQFGASLITALVFLLQHSLHN